MENKIKTILDKNRVSALYVFGSMASHKAGPLSDYDLGILFTSRINPKSYLKKQLVLFEALSRLFKTNKIDIVILNEAPPLLAMNIIDEGKILFDIDPRERVDFETRVTMKYLDRLPYERRYLKSLLQNI